MARKRNRASAKKAGSGFERQIADYLAEHIDDRIDRRVKRGSKDLGDIAGVRAWGERIVIECKNVARMALPQWLREAEIARGNDDALAGIVIHKAHGDGDPANQRVTMRLIDLVAILTGMRPGQ